MNIWNKRIPTLLSLGLVLIGIAATSYLTFTGVITIGRAAPGENPQAIRITNITDTSFTVTYTTSESVIGSLSTGTDSSLGQVVLDDRDQPSGIPSQYQLHSITARNLKPLTKYFFAVSSGKTTYLNRDAPFTIITGPHIAGTPPAEVPVAGSIELVSGESPPEAIVYISSQNGETLSTLAKSNGLYIVPLNSMRTSDLNSYNTFTDASTLQLLIVGETETSRVALFANKRNPVPKITLSNNYDFTLNTSPVASTSGSFIGFPAFSLDNSIQPQPKIETPSKNQQFTDQQPLLQGKGLPNQTVNIIIHSQTIIQSTVTTDQYGNWTYRPTTPLPPGQHTISITTPDQNGILRTLQQTFTVFASGTQVAEAATPSATPTTFVPTPTNTPIPILTTAPTTIPSLSPTLTPTLGVTSTPTILTPIPSGPTPKPTIAPTGNNTLVTSGIITLVTTAAGVVLFLISRGASL